MRRFLAFALFFASPALADRPAWEEASKYICRAQEVRNCEAAQQSCSKRPGIAVFVVDFGAGTFKPLASDPKFAEKMIFKRYKEYEHVSATHVVMLDGGARMLQFTGSLRTVGTERWAPAVFVSAYGDQVVTQYLKCSPSD